MIGAALVLSALLLPTPAAAATGACRLIVGALETDADGDGISDTCDLCPDTIDDVPAPDDTTRIATGTDGCGVSDRCPCDGPPDVAVPWRSHGAYVRCVAAHAGRLVASRRLTTGERDAVVESATRATCGRSHRRPGDFDGDGIADGVDDCPRVANPAQLDTDDDGPGDACDADRDGDGVPDVADDCPGVSNADQEDTTDAAPDDVGDACDLCPDTPAGAVVDAVGCATGQRCPCQAPRLSLRWRSHADYEGCVRLAAADFVRQGRLVPAQAATLRRRAARSTCGRRALAPARRLR